MEFTISDNSVRAPIYFGQRWGSGIQKSCFLVFLYRASNLRRILSTVWAMWSKTEVTIFSPSAASYFPNITSKIRLKSSCFCLSYALTGMLAIPSKHVPPSSVSSRNEEHIHCHAPSLYLRHGGLNWNHLHPLSIHL